MSRHSKWHKVKQFKGAIDAKRSASFTKLAREITVSAREKGADPNMNARLRAAIYKAREGSMPKENIERAIQRGAGGGEDGQIEALTYEAYAPGGTALIIECLTDNRNRTASEVKHVLSKAGGTLAGSGAVTYLFERLGSVHVPGALLPPERDQAELQLIDAGATDIVYEDDAYEVRSVPNDLTRIAEVVARCGAEPDVAELVWMPGSFIETDEATGTAVAELIDTLEALDDVHRVFSNLA